MKNTAIQSTTLVSVDMVPNGDSWIASCKVVATRTDGRKYHAHATFEEGFTPDGRYGNLDMQRKFKLGGVRLRKVDGGFVQIKESSHIMRSKLQTAIINELVNTGHVTPTFS